MAQKTAASMGATWLRMEGDNILELMSLQSPLCKAVVECQADWLGGCPETLLCQVPLGLFGTSVTSGFSGGPTAPGQLPGPQLEM